MLRLQGFPEDFKTVGSYTALRKLIGNSVPVPMIQASAANMLSAMETEESIPILKQAKLVEAL